MDALTLRIGEFEGPMDLLLHLIKEMKIDIYNIPMVELTHQYLSYIQSMQEMELEVASEYLLMAATLLEIKARMLLPKPKVEIDEVEVEEDPRDELVEKLMEYKQFQEGAKKLETRVFFTLTIAQATALSIWGAHQQLDFFQFLAIHLSFAFYVLSRTGWLSQGRLGIMVWFDLMQAFYTLPFKNFMASCIVFLHEEESSEKTNDSYSKNFQHFVILIGSLLASGVLVYFVWTQLSQVSGNFANLFIQLSAFSQTFFDSLFSKIDIATILAQLFLAIPVSLYLYGLIVGSLLSERTSTFNYQVFQEKVQPLRAIPNFAAYIVIGSLLVTYILFFTTGLSELGNLLSAGTVTEAISPQSASSIAVTGFWQLVRVSLLNFAVLGAFYLISKKPLWDQIGTRLATTLLFIFATLLTLLAGWKLFGVYIYLYGPTPLRLLSGWFVLVLLVWCLLILIRLYKPIQAIRIGILYAMISFTILCYLYPFLLK